MSPPIAYVDRSRVRPGALAELRAGMSKLVEFIEANEPRIITYAVFFDPDGSHMTVIHVHPDEESLVLHLTIGGPLFAAVAPLVTLLGIDVYGPVGADALARIEGKAQMLGGARVSMHEHHAGFARTKR